METRRGRTFSYPLFTRARVCVCVCVLEECAFFGARTPTLEGKLRISDLRPSKARKRHCSWLYSTILSAPPARVMNSTIRSKSLREARRAGENTTAHQKAQRTSRHVCRRLWAADSWQVPCRTNLQTKRQAEARAKNGNAVGFTKPSWSRDHHLRLDLFPVVLAADLRLGNLPVVFEDDPRARFEKGRVEFQLVGAPAVGKGNGWDQSAQVWRV